VTIGAHDVALGDFIEDLLPIPARELFGHLEALVSQMVELED
jgi:hypothetical protein